MRKARSPQLAPLLFATASACATTSGTTPAWAPASALQPPDPTRYPGAPAIYLFRETRYFMRVGWSGPVGENSGDVDALAKGSKAVGGHDWGRTLSLTRQIQHDAIAILGRKGLSYAKLRVPRSARGRIVELRARTIDPHGSAKDVALKAFAETELTDDEATNTIGRMALFEVPEVQVGTVIEYSYTIDTPSMSSELRGFANDSIPIEHYRLQIEVPKDTIYSVSVYNDPHPWQTEQGRVFVEGQNVDVFRLTWSSDRLAASIREALSPARSYRDPWWRFRVLQFVNRGQIFDVNRSWETALRDSANRLYLGRRDAGAGFAPSIQDQDCPDARCRIQRALDFVTEEAPFRAHGVEWRTRPPKRVVESKSATNFEKTWLLFEILKGRGIMAEYAYCTPHLWNFTDPNAASPNFDHQILWLPVQAGLRAGMFVDPSCEFCRLGELPEWDLGVTALIVHPPKTSLEQREEASVEFKVIDGRAPPATEFRTKLHVRTATNGDAAISLRLHAQGRSAQTERRTQLRESAASGSPITGWTRTAGAQAEIRSITPYTLSGATGTRVIEYAVHAYAAVDGDRMIVPLRAFTSDWDGRFLDEERKTDVDALWTSFREDVATIEAPSGWSLEALPENRAVETPGLTTRVAAKEVDGRAVITRSIRFARGHYEKARYPDLKRAVDLFRNARTATVTFARTASPAR